MKKQLLLIVLLMPVACLAIHPDQSQKSGLTVCAQTAAGSALTAGFAYVLKNLATDIKTRKYYQSFELSKDFFSNNKDTLIKDGLTSVALLYALVHAGGYTVARFGELLQILGQEKTGA
jgi:hypothetical protein